MRWAGHVARKKSEDRCIEGFVGKTGGEEITWKKQA
jgi:hypothetical protein